MYWLGYIHFSHSDIDAGLLVSLVYGLQIHLQLFLSDIDVGLTVSSLYIMLIHLQFFVFDTEIGLPAFFFLIQKIHLHISFPCSDAAGPASFP